MQRTQIKTGDVLAHRRGQYDVVKKATVLTTEPVTPTYSGWGRTPEMHDIALPDGTTVNVPYRLASEVAYKRADKLVLVKMAHLARYEDDDMNKPVYEDRITAVHARELVGYYEEEKAKETAAREAATKASNERARLRREQYDQYAALRERAQALVAEADLVEAPNARISIDRASLDALLELAEHYADLSNS